MVDNDFAGIREQIGRPNRAEARGVGRLPIGHAADAVAAQFVTIIHVLPAPGLQYAHFSR